MRYLLSFTASCLLSTAIMAQSDIQIHGTRTQTIPITPSEYTTNSVLKQPATKSIGLMNITLSPHAWHHLDQRIDNIDNTMQSADSIQLGMNHLPVLNQGEHGTCATFAVTAALDAALEKGDYISQLCNLQLGQEIEQLGYNKSGWDGSFNPIILNQISTFGIVTKATQETTGCGANLTEYPTDTDETPPPSLSFSEYHALSEPLSKSEIAWSPILDIYQAFLDDTNAKKTLKTVKKALKNKDRLTFSVLLFGLHEGIGGATGQHHVSNDTWLLTPSIINHYKNQEDYGGHAMIITGFDDTATAIDSNGKVHKGLLTIRNSWGADTADHGDFYMSYDYFKLFTIDVQRIRSLKHLSS